LNPGPALCKVCSFYVPQWTFSNPANDTFCDDESPDDWLFLSGADEQDLIDCCHSAHAQEVILPTSGGCDFSLATVDPIPKTKSCLYNMVVNCLGIYTLPNGWPLPTPYPSDTYP
jgi:hypothetical protein